MVVLPQGWLAASQLTNPGYFCVSVQNWFDTRHLSVYNHRWTIRLSLLSTVQKSEDKVKIGFREQQRCVPRYEVQTNVCNRIWVPSDDEYIRHTSWNNSFLKEAFSFLENYLRFLLLHPSAKGPHTTRDSGPVEGDHSMFSMFESSTLEPSVVHSPSYSRVTKFFPLCKEDILFIVFLCRNSPVSRPGLHTTSLYKREKIFFFLICFSRLPLS